MHALVGFLLEPLLQLLVEMGLAVEGPVAHKEMLFQIAHHAFVFAFGLRPPGFAGAGPEAIVASEIDKARVELDTPSGGMEQDSGFLVIHQHLLGHAAKVLETADQPFVGVFGILAGGTPDVKAPRVGELIDDELDGREQPGNGGGDRAPIALELAAGQRFKAHGGAAGLLRALGREIGTEQG